MELVVIRSVVAKVVVRFSAVTKVTQHVEWEMYYHPIGGGDVYGCLEGNAFCLMDTPI